MTISTLEYALMAGNAYQSSRSDTNKIPFPGGWAPLAGPLDHMTGGMGFEATAYVKQDGGETNIVISFAGTQGLSLDWVSNIALGLGLTGIDSQLRSAAVYYEEIK